MSETEKKAFLPWGQTENGNDLTGTNPGAEYPEDRAHENWQNPYFKRKMREEEEGGGVRIPYEIPFKRHQREPFVLPESSQDVRSGLTMRAAPMNTDVFPYPQELDNDDWYALTYG